MGSSTQQNGTHKLLESKIAIVYGATGAVGTTVAKAFATAGASVHLTGRDEARLSLLAKEIAAQGGRAKIARVDALDAPTIEAHAQRVIDEEGRLDISFNAVGLAQDKTPYQGIPIAQLSEASFMEPILTYARSHFLTARAAAKHMMPARAGVILMHTPEAPVLGIAHMGGMTPAWAGIEALSRDLSAELAPHGIRSIVVRTTGLPETSVIHTVVDLHAKAIGVSTDEFWGFTHVGPHTRRSTTLRELADGMVFAASDLSAGLTGSVLNLTSGKTAL